MNFITIVSVLVAVLYGAEACEDDTRKQRAQALTGWGTEPLRALGHRAPEGVVAQHKMSFVSLLRKK